nr:retrovirus-related Pol polyprotein from transposon TNT 1-94 [Tanacetum cinerariifolium]
MQQIQDKAKKSCMLSFQKLHSHLKLLSNNKLKGTRTADGFKRAFATLFRHDVKIFTGTMFLNVVQLEKQLDKEEFQEIGSMAAFRYSRHNFIKQDTSCRSGNDAHADDAYIIPIYDEDSKAEVTLIGDHNVFAIGQQHAEQPKFITTHYLTKGKESACAKPHHMIAPGSSRFNSNDIVHNHHLEKAKKKTQESGRNLRPSVMSSARSQSTTNGSKLKPKSNTHTSRNWPESKSSFVTTKTVNSCVKVPSNKITNTNKPVEQTSFAKKPKRQIPKGHSFSIKKTSVVHEKTMTPRSCLRWKPTSKIFKTVGLRWVPTGKIFTSSITKVDSEPTNGSNEDIINQYKCEQTLDVSASTLNLSVDFQDSPDNKEDTRSSHEYLNDLEEEYQARALLEKSKRFFKKEEVSSDENEMVEGKVLTTLAEENNVVSKEGARNGEWIKISMRKYVSSFFPPLKKLDGAEPISGPKTITLILRSKSTFKAEALENVTINKPSSASAKGNKSSSTLKVHSAAAGKLKSVKLKDDPSLAIVMKELNNLKLQFSKNRSSHSRNDQSQHTPQNKYKTQFKKSCELCGLNNHLTGNCYKVLFCKKCERTDHKTCVHAEYISTMNMSQHLKSLGRMSEDITSQDHQNASFHLAFTVVDYLSRKKDQSKNPQHAFKKCKAFGSLNHTTTDHYDIEWFKRGEALQAKKAEALKSTRAKSSNANRSKTLTKNGCSRHMTGVKNYLYKYMEQPGPKVVFGDDYTCTTKGYGSLNVMFDEKRGTIFNSNKEIIMIAPRVRDVYVLEMTSSAQESCFFAKASKNLNWLWHKRLAHLNFKIINKLAKQNLVIGLPSLVYLKDKPCSSCEKGKHHRASFKTKQTSSIKKCLYLLYMDLFRPVTPRSINHEKYTLVIVDEYSRVFNTRRQQTEETYHTTFNESHEAIKFLKPLVDNINIAESERYPPDEYLYPCEPSQRKSTSGACQLLGGKLVCWSDKKQQSVAMSSAEAEYVAAAGCCANILWMKSQLTDYDIIYEKVPIFCDNTSAIAISNNPVLHSRTKHIDIRYHFVRDHILKWDIELHFIPTQY